MRLKERIAQLLRWRLELTAPYVGELCYTTRLRFLACEQASASCLCCTVAHFKINRA